jgi:hypothetical protein
MRAGEVLAEVAGETTGQSLAFENGRPSRAFSLWDIDDPVLYVIEVELRTGPRLRTASPRISASARREFHDPKASGSMAAR